MVMDEARTAAALPPPIARLHVDAKVPGEATRAFFVKFNMQQERSVSASLFRQWLFSARTSKGQAAVAATGVAAAIR